VKSSHKIQEFEPYGQYTVDTVSIKIACTYNNNFKDKYPLHLPPRLKEKYSSNISTACLCFNGRLQGNGLYVLLINILMALVFI